MKRNINIPLFFFVCFFLMTSTAYPYQLTEVKYLFELRHDFLQPSDVAVGSQHWIYVLDGINNQVKVFNDEGKFIFAFGGKGSQEGLFLSPVGITIDKQGYVYVADTGNHRVQIFSPEGKYLSMFQVKSTGAESPCDPVDVAIDNKRKRAYVVDNDNHQILLYNVDNRTKVSLTGVWGSEGDERGKFRYPFFIALGKGGTIFIVDVLNTRIQGWSPQGKVVSIIGDWGIDLGQFYRPKGVCVDTNNFVYVSDSYLGVIQVFNRYGNFVSVVGNDKGGVMKWRTPVGITIDDRQRLYVVEMLLNSVKVYQILDKKAERKQ